MNHWWTCVTFALAACPHAAPTPIVDASLADASMLDASADVTVAAPDASLSRLMDVLTHPDKVEAWTLDTSAFWDTGFGGTERINGYRIKRRLGAPATPTFSNNLWVTVSADHAYRTSAVLCALGKAVGIRWTRGSDVAETHIMEACPSMGIATNFGATMGGQLEPEPYARALALFRAAYPTGGL